MAKQKQPSSVFAEKGVLKNFTIFTRKHLCWSLFLITLQACNLLKKRLQHRCFLVNIAKFLRTPILKNICKRLLLSHNFFKTAVLEIFENSMLNMSGRILFVNFLKPNYNQTFPGIFRKGIVSKFHF